METIFDHEAWLREFYQIVKTNYDKAKKLRVDVFNQTIHIVKERNYSTGKTRFYKEVQPIVEPGKYNTKVSVMHGDCLEVARLLVNAGHKPAVLNMANANTPGGGVKHGAGAQEENLCRRSNLYESLYQYRSHYPIHPLTGAIYSSSITVFRGSEAAGYALLEQPFIVDIISNAAIYKPNTESIREEIRLSAEAASDTKEKIRTIYRVCHEQGNHCMVLSAFGCGAFRNPPRHMAQLFKEILMEEEFKNVFDTIVFAIIDDRNAHHEHNIRGNYLPFLEVFEAGI